MIIKKKLFRHRLTLTKNDYEKNFIRHRFTQILIDIKYYFLVLIRELISNQYLPIYIWQKCNDF